MESKEHDMINIKELDECELKRKYGNKLERYIRFAEDAVLGSKKGIEYTFYKVRNSNITYITKNWDIENSKKAYVYNEKMYVSDWAMEQNKETLMHIIIHELMHIFYPDYTEEAVIKYTDIEFEKLKKDYKWIVFS